MGDFCWSFLRFLSLIAIQVNIMRTYELKYLTTLMDTTGTCSHTSTLEYGFTVEWAAHPHNIFTSGVYAYRPGEIYDCTITFTGRPDLAGMMTRTSVSFREEFLFAEVGLASTKRTAADCGKAYIQLWNETQFNAPSGEPIWTHCSLGQLPDPLVFETDEHNLILKIYVDFTIQIPHSNVTMNPNETTTAAPITTSNPLDYPRIHFSADFTSYVENATCDNEEYLLCNDSRRCLERTDVCDVGLAWNCRSNSHFWDASDKSSGYPSFCNRQSFSEIEVDLLPLWCLIGILGGLMVLYWCFWKPGYLPWRCGRLRNMGGSGTNSSGKRRCAVGGLCATGGLCGPPTPEGKAGACSFCTKCFVCCQGSAITKMGGRGGGYGGDGGRAGNWRGSGHPSGILPNGGKGGMLESEKHGKSGAGDWRVFCEGDGLHLTECR